MNNIVSPDFQNSVPAAPAVLPDAFLFDCDGTITCEEYLPYVVGMTLAQELVKIGKTYDDQRFHDVFNANVGGGFDKYMAKYLEASSKAGEDLSGFPKEELFLTAVVGNYVHVLKAWQAGQANIPFSIRPGMIDGITEAVQTGRPVFITTNARSTIVRANMAAAGIYIKGEPIPDGVTPKVLIDGVVCLDDIKRAAQEKSAETGQAVDWKTMRKPAGFPYEMTCREASALMSQRLGYEVIIRPERCIGFEDSRNGHESLARAGVGTRVHMSNDIVAQPFDLNVDGRHCPPDLVVSAEGMSVQTMKGILAYHAAKVMKASSISLGVACEHLLAIA